MKRLFTFFVLLFALASAVYVFTGKDVEAPSRVVSAPEDVSELTSPTRLIVYYFEMGKDCSTCLNLETYTRETLETHFSEDLASGAIRWEAVDVDRAEHGHFVEEFGLYTKSVVLVTVDGGDIVEHNNLSRIWELVYDKEAYIDYIRGQVDEALGAAS